MAQPRKHQLKAAFKKVALAGVLAPALAACAATDFSRVNDDTCMASQGHSLQMPLLGTSEFSQEISKECMTVKAFEQSTLIPAQQAGRPLTVYEEIMAIELHKKLSPEYKTTMEQALARYKQKTIEQMKVQAGEVSCTSVSASAPDAVQRVEFACGPIAPPPALK